MGINMIVCGVSGSGKSSSAAPPKTYGEDFIGLDPKETFVLAGAMKGMPFKGFNKHYKHIEGKNLKSGNLLKVEDRHVLALPKILEDLASSSYKNILFDDINLLYTRYVLNREGDMRTVYSDLYGSITDLLNAFIMVAEKTDKNVVQFYHTDVTQVGSIVKTEIKLPGKAVNRSYAPESLVNICLQTEPLYDMDSIKYTFRTQMGEGYISKSPHTLFDTNIPNDLGYVLHKAHKYFN